MHSTILGTGSYLPKRILTNFDLEKMVDTTHDWIVSRTGIMERHIATETETTSDLALNASLQAIRAAGIDKQDIDLIVLATTTPDSVFPSTACLLQNKLGIKNCPAFDIQAVCSGFVYAVALADQFIRTQRCQYALVVGAEIFSRLVNWSDRTTCVLFGDGAGAAVMGKARLPGVISCHLHADGSHANQLAVPGRICAGGIAGTPYVVMDGGAVFKFAVKVMDEMVDETLGGGKIGKEDIDWLVPHQANIRIIQAAARKLSLNMDRVVVTVDKHANTSAASIPLALDTAVRDGRIKKNHIILMEAVGGGFTWGSVLARWSFNFKENKN